MKRSGAAEEGSLAKKKNNPPRQKTVRAVQRFEIRIEGCLEPQWAEWFEGMEIATTGNGDSVITGVVIDQAALFGLIAKLRDLGVKLLAINLQ